MARPFERIAAGIAFILGLATILGALGSQYIGGLQPCDLCLQQRMPYYWGLPLLALILVLWGRLPKQVKIAGMAIVAALFAYGAYLGAFHSGVEWGFWPGPTTCSGLGESLSLDSLNDLKPVIGCDVVQFRFLGISMAGYNAIISLAIAGLLTLSILRTSRQR
ncbi:MULTISPECIES: disulfide bond formation protein B [unclassified Devosia]|uniref:disulfide bond formation protein B n=1 Tax=unclassified Devosia TaxID=196773 RepID=UPI00145F471A|nr:MULTISPECIES: disulfide bond formation protein B [unclassified Devosia]MBJ6987654.1 disulfide bond formation protein B [Devosia sp. MC521]MBK1795352.1 disulfide bond formation protein B [Devosia sp. WQ 349K1]QMW62338.1 disulfide bond formation protein B [Devosia sp. MC521]